MRRAIVDGTFQRFTCRACGRGYTVEGPLFFFDPDAGLWFGVYPPRWEEAWRALEEQLLASFRSAMVEFAPPIVQEEAGRYTVRALFGLDALRDKVLAFDAGLDDAAFETLKLDLLRRTPALSIAGRPRLVAVAATRITLHAGDDALELDRSAVAAVAEGAQWQAARAAVAGAAYVDVGRTLLAGDAPRPAS